MLNRTSVLFMLIFFNVFLPNNIPALAVPLQLPALSPSCLSCSAFPKAVNTAIISSKCNTLSPEQICVANNPVSVDYASSGQSSTPTGLGITYTDQRPLANFSSIVTSAVDLDSAKWGVAFVKVQAFESNVVMKLPLSLIMYGDAHLLAEIPNAGAQPSATPNVIACTGTTTRGTYLRSKPGDAAQQLQFLQSNTSVTVFGRSADNWLLADNHGIAGWVYAPVIKLSCALADLSIFQPDDRSTALVKTPVTLPTLPAFRFFSGSAASTCDSVPTGGMLIQIPSTYYATLVIDGVHITATNTLINVEAQSSQALTISVLQGKATIEATGKQSIVGLGQQVSVLLAGSDGLNPNSAPTNPITTRLGPKAVDEMCTIAHNLGLNLPCGQTIRYSVGTAVPPIPASGNVIPPVPTNCTFTVRQFSTDQNPVELSRSFSGAPACVSTTLRWNVEGVQTVMLDGRPIGNQGAVSVCTNHTQTYTLTLICSGETRTVSYTLDAVTR